jgi:N utilization substance protein B
MSAAESKSEARRQARHQARILAMQALYEADVARHPADAVLERLIGEGPAAAAQEAGEQAGGAEVALQRLIGEHAYSPATVDFAWRLVRGVVLHLDEIDPLIAAAAPTWPLAQMAKIDKSILRLAVYEVLHEPDVPYKAAINEAVELAKVYGSDSSSRFVNGVLGTIAAKKLGARAQHAEPPQPPASG